MGDAQKHNTRIFEHNVSDPICDGKHPSAPECNTNLLRLPIDQPPIPTNKMAVDGPRSAESLRHLACSLAALDPAPWEKVRLVEQ